MGFFSSLLKTIAPIASAVLGIAPTPAAAPAQQQAPKQNILKGIAPPAPVQAIATIPQLGISGGLTAKTEVPISQLIAGPPRAMGGMKNRIETRVLTVAPNGTVLNVKVLDGAPWLMRKDFVIMKRVIRTLSRGEKRIPRKRTKSAKEAEELALMKGLVKGLIASGGHHGHGQGVTIVDT